MPLSVQLFPKVASLVDLGDNAFPLGNGKSRTHCIQTVYASKYVPNKAKGEITWTPVKGVSAMRKCRHLEYYRQGNPTLVVLETGGNIGRAR